MATGATRTTRDKGRGVAAGRGQAPDTDADHPRWAPEEERSGEFREALAVGGWRFELVSRQPVGGNWGAWVRRATEDGSAGGGERFRALTATGATAAEALAALADAIRAIADQPTPPGEPA